MKSGDRSVDDAVIVFGAMVSSQVQIGAATFMSGKQIIKKYSEDQLKDLLAQYDKQNLTNTEIAEKFGVNRSTISRWRKKFNMQLGVWMPISDADLVKKYHDEHSNIADLAKELGVSKDSVRLHLIKGGVKNPRKSDPKKVQKNVLKYHYSEDELKQILVSYSGQGLSKVEMARRLDSNRRTIGRWFKKFGLNKPQASDKVTDEQLCTEYLKGHSANYVAKKYDVSHDFVIRHLKAQGVFKGKTHGMKTARHQMHDDMWDHIKQDLDRDMYKQEIVSKYHISMPSLNGLMKRHQYYPEFSSFSDLSLDDIPLIMDQLKITNRVRRNRIEHYLVGICEFITVCGYAPTVIDLSRFLNMPYHDVYRDTRSLIFQRYMSTHTRLSYIVRKLCRILKQLNVSYELNNRHLISPYEIDVWIPKYNIGFEIDPASTHSTSRRNYLTAKSKINRRLPSNYHQAKSLMAFEHGIRLVHIYDWTELSVSLVQNWLEFQTFDFRNKIINLDQLLVTKDLLHQYGYYGRIVQSPISHYVSGNYHHQVQLSELNHKATAYVLYDAGKLILQKYKK